MASSRVIEAAAAGDSVGVATLAGCEHASTAVVTSSRQRTTAREQVAEVAEGCLDRIGSSAPVWFAFLRHTGLGI